MGPQAAPNPARWRAPLPIKGFQWAARGSILVAMGRRFSTASGSRALLGLASVVGALSLINLAAPPREAQAFCGFYVGGGDKKLVNNATVVVLLRDGTRTVLSMQNNYQGPPERFAMVVPVPVVLQKENVKTLPREVFDHIDQLAAPRLVEYWEQDPCPSEQRNEAPGRAKGAMAAPAPQATAAAGASYGVKVEAQFTVGEYEIVILSAKDSNGLDRWLKDNQYTIPEGAEPLLRPYVQNGSKFFVAKVDVSKVRMENGMAMLSPLRFHYDSEKFSLPVRLGLANSSGTQDLLVHIVARGQRYELANYKNVTIPTNIDVDDKVRDEFPAFYAALFDRTLETNLDADKRPPVVTEYSWDTGSCDPCPGPPLQPGDIATLGADTLQAPESPAPPPSPPVVKVPQPGKVAGGCGCTPGDLMCAMKCSAARAPGSVPSMGPRPGPAATGSPGMGRGPSYYGYVLTRLHARYTKDQLAEDLVFREAAPIMGGREIYGAPGGKQATGAQKSGVNNFQGRYAIRHPWTGPIACANPRRGIWGGPPAGQSGGGTKAARDLAFAPRGGIDLPAIVQQNIPEINVVAKNIPVLLQPLPTPKPTSGPRSVATPVDDEDASGCGCRVPAQGAEQPSWGALALGLVAALGAVLRRKTRGGESETRARGAPAR